LAEGGAIAIVVTNEHVILPEADDTTSSIAVVGCGLQHRQYRIEDVPNVHHEGDALVDAPSISRVAKDNFRRIGESLGGGGPLTDKNTLN